MILSPAKMAANQANAQKSTGPKSQEGKNICRENAVRHGLSGAGVVLPAHMRVAVEEIVADWYRDHPPQSAYEAALVRTMALAMVRMEEGDARLFSYEHARRHELASNWDEIQGDAAAKLAEKLAKRPDRVVQQLRATSHGCSWMCLRWEALREGLEPAFDWTDTETELFFDLLGFPVDLRERSQPVRGLRHRIDQAKLGDREALEKLRALVADHIRELTDRAHQLRETTEAVRRELIANGGWIETTAESRNLRKLVRGAERLFENTWAKIQDIRRGQSEACAGGPKHAVDKSETSSPQALTIEVKAPPPSPLSPLAGTHLEEFSLSDLATLLGLPDGPVDATPHARAAWEQDVMQAAVAMELISPEQLGPALGAERSIAPARKSA